MSIANIAEGDYTLTGTETPALYTLTKPGVFVWVCDMSAMQAGDAVLLRVRTRIRNTGTGATERVIIARSLSGAQDPPNVELGPFTSDQLVAKLSASQSAGSYRVMPWKLLRVGD